MILSPYVEGMLRPETRHALEPYGDLVQWRRIDPDDRTQYARILTECWGMPGPLLIVEQDVEIRPGVVEELTACPEPWCGFPYQIGEQFLVCLGCTRFSAALLAAHPGLMGEAARVDSAMDGGGVPAGVWQRMDVRIGALLEREGFRVHRHEPAVIHHHWYPPAQEVPHV